MQKDNQTSSSSSASAAAAAASPDKNENQIAVHEKGNNCVKNEICSKITNLDIQSSSSSANNQQFFNLNNTALICDAWYGFPIQKRPRQERILAVSRQIHNHIIWNNTYINTSSSSSSTTNGNTNTNLNANNKLKQDQKKKKMLNAKAKVYVIGKVDDVNSIKERVDQLEKEQEQKEEMMILLHRTECIYLPGMEIEELCDQLSVSSITTYNDTVTTTASVSASDIPTFNHKESTSNVLKIARSSVATYLSPDASDTLNPKEIPPSIIIVGMLVDRKVQPNRSKSRAEQIMSQQQQQEQQQNNDEVKASITVETSDGKQQHQSISAHHFSCARLPLDVLNVSDLGSDEALNIDTVLEMIQRWWYNCSHLSFNRDSNTSTNTNTNTNENNQDMNDSNRSTRTSTISPQDLPINYFKDAAARALLTHRNRHPKRTIHGKTIKAKT